MSLIRLPNALIIRLFQVTIGDLPFIFSCLLFRQDILVGRFQVPLHVFAAHPSVSFWCFLEFLACGLYVINIIGRVSASLSRKLLLTIE